MKRKFTMKWPRVASLGDTIAALSCSATDPLIDSEQ